LERPQRTEGGIRVCGEGNRGGEGGIEAAAAAAEISDGFDFVLGTDTALQPVGRPPEAEAALADAANARGDDLHLGHPRLCIITSSRWRLWRHD
jgi:hypothetical protein